MVTTCRAANIKSRYKENKVILTYLCCLACVQFGINPHISFLHNHVKHCYFFVISPCCVRQKNLVSLRSIVEKTVGSHQ